jgi:hypothetical protein
MSDEEYQAMINSPIDHEIMRRGKESMEYLHNHFLKVLYSRFPRFYNYLLETEPYLMEDLWDGELISITSTWTLLRYIEVLMKSWELDEVLGILAYMEEWYQSEDPEIKDLVIGFVNDSYIVPDILHKFVELLPPGMHSHFMEYNSDLLNR